MLRRPLLAPILLALALLLPGCAILVGTPPEYKGADAGQVVIGIGASRFAPFNMYMLLFRRVDEPRGDPGADTTFAYFRQVPGSPQQPDYDRNGAAGVVLAASLAPGRYEFFTTGVSNSGANSKVYYSGREQWFSIPFTVQAGKAVYVGNYEAVPAPSGKGVLWVVDDRFADDVALARRHIPAQTVAREVADATADPLLIASPFFVARPAR